MVGVSFELGSFDFVRKLSLDETTLLYHYWNLSDEPQSCHMRRQVLNVGKTLGKTLKVNIFF